MSLIVCGLQIQRIPWKDISQRKKVTPFPELRSAGRGLKRKDHEFTFGPVEFGVSLRYARGKVC